jgi:guanine nucleotide-binding protein subunit gamma
MSELKLRRLLEHNQRLREDLGRPRIRVSEASASLIRYCKTTTDHLVSLSLFLPSNLYPNPQAFPLLFHVALLSFSSSNLLPPILFTLFRSMRRGFRTDIVLSSQVPSVWGPVGKNEDPYAPQSRGGCCTVQ